MWSCRRTGKAVGETRRPFSLRGFLRPYASRAAARWIASPRRACAGAIFSFMSARISGGAVSGEPALNGGAGLYSSPSWIASALSQRQRKIDPRGHAAAGDAVAVDADARL